MNDAEVSHLIESMILIIFLLFVYFLFIRLTWVQKKFDLLIEKIGNRVMFGKNSNVLILIDMFKNNAMVEVTLEFVPECLKDVTLAKSNLKGN